MKQATSIPGLIKKYGLKPETVRKVSIFSASGVAEAYVLLLKKEGMGHEAVGASTAGNKTTFYLSLSKINTQMKEVFKHIGIREFLDKYQKLYEKTRQELEKDNYHSYPEYLRAMGAIKSLVRYIDSTHEFPSYHQEIGLLFNKVAETYTKVENMLPESIKPLTIQEYRDNIVLEKPRKEFSFVFDGTYHISNEILQSEEIKKESASGKGIGGNKIQGVVSHVPKKDHILVTSMTDPAISVSQCKAVVTDEGGMLCHAAITCRELGIACVVGTKYATKVFKDGDIIEVDANKGIVRKIKKTNRNDILFGKKYMTKKDEKNVRKSMDKFQKEFNLKCT